MSQPYFEGNVRMKLTLPKLALGSPPKFPKLQSSITRIKTPRIGYSLYHLKVIGMQISKMASHGPFGHLQHKSWQKEGMGVKLVV